MLSLAVLRRACACAVRLGQLVTLNKQALGAKPAVSIRVFDQDEAGHDLLGSTEVPLYKITSAEHAKLDDEIVDGKVYKGRVLRLDNHPLTMPGMRMQSTINLMLYFSPDLPPEVMLEEQAERRAQNLSEEYMARLKEFYGKLPGRIRTQLDEAMLKELARGRYAAALPLKPRSDRRTDDRRLPTLPSRHLAHRTLAELLAVCVHEGSTSSNGSIISGSSPPRTRMASSISTPSTSRRSSRPPR